MKASHQSSTLRWPISVLLLSYLVGCSTSASSSADYRDSYDVFWKLVQRREQARIKLGRLQPVPPDIGDLVERKKKKVTVLERGAHAKDLVHWQGKFQGVELEKNSKTGSERRIVKFDLPVEYLGKIPTGSATDTFGACRYRVRFECDEQDFSDWEKVSSGTSVSFTGEMDEMGITSYTRGNQWFKKGVTSFQLSNLPTEVGVQFEAVITILHTRINTGDAESTTATEK